MKNNYFSYEITNIIKGIAIFMMFVYHVLTFGQWFPASFVPSDLLVKFALSFHSPLIMCVCTFAFLTGYFHYFNEDKSFKYSINKILYLLINYWIVLFLLLISAIYFGYIINLKELILEMFGIQNRIGIFNWYVYFYIIVMFTLPLIFKYLNMNRVCFIVIGFVLPFLLPRIIIQYLPDDSLLIEVMKNIYRFYPCVSSGIYCAKYKVFQKIDLVIDDVFKNRILKIIICFILLLISFFIRNYFDSAYLGRLYMINIYVDVEIKLYFLYISLFLYSLINLIKLIKIIPLQIIFSILGKHSTSMWFVHCIFFNEYSGLYKNILYSMKHPVLILLFGILSSLIVSIIVDYIMNRIKRHIYIK